MMKLPSFFMEGTILHPLVGIKSGVVKGEVNNYEDKIAPPDTLI